MNLLHRGQDTWLRLALGWPPEQKHVRKKDALYFHLHKEIVLVKLLPCADVEAVEPNDLHVGLVEEQTAQAL